jgi:magnesium transporter
MNTKTLEALIRERDFKTLKAALSGLDRDQIVGILSGLSPAQAVVVFRLLEKTLALEVFETLSSSEQADLVSAMDDPEMGEILSEEDPADLVALLEELPAKVVKRAVATLSKDSRDRVNALLGYPADSVGRSIDPRYLTVSEDETVAQALAKVRVSTLDEEDVEVVFVVSEGRRYRGYVTVTRLLRADPGAPVGSLPLNEESVLAYDPIRKATEKLTRLRLPVLAVVDREGRLVGSLRAADALELVEEEEASRLVQFGGALASMGGPDIDLRTTPITKIFTARFFWLAVLTFFGVITSTFVAAQEAMLDKVMILAAFIAPIIDMGGNTGSQSATLVIRGMALGQIQMNWRGLWFALRKDLLVALALGVTIAVLEVILAFAFKRDVVSFDVLMVVGLSMLVVTVAGSLIGLVLPFAARKCRVDPATLSAPAITSIMDLLGVMIYFGMAVVFLGDLLK